MGSFPETYMDPIFLSVNSVGYCPGRKREAGNSWSGEVDPLSIY